MKSIITIICFLIISPVIARAEDTSSPSIKQIREAAENGEAVAQYELWKAYHIGEGDGIPQDDTKAVEWFRKSAEQGNLDAKNALSTLPNGRLVSSPKNDKDTAPIYEKIALGIVTIPVAAIVFVFKNVAYVALSLI
jgi:TPR repeat protein